MNNLYCVEDWGPSYPYRISYASCAAVCTKCEQRYPLDSDFSTASETHRKQRNQVYWISKRSKTRKYWTLIWVLESLRNHSPCFQEIISGWFFPGQQVVDEIVDSRRPSCPPEYSNIDIPNDYKLYKSAGDPKRMPFVRTRYDQTTGKSPGNPRQQVRQQAWTRDKRSRLKRCGKPLGPVVQKPVSLTLC